MVVRQLLLTAIRLLVCLSVALPFAGGMGMYALPAFAAPTADAEEVKEAPDDEDDDENDEALNFVKFHISFKKALNSDETYDGQKVVAVLQDDIFYRGRPIALKGSKVYGHVEAVTRGKNIVRAVVDKDPLHRHGSIVLRFDRIKTTSGEELQMLGRPIPQSSLFSNGETIRQVQVGLNGDIVKTLDTSMAQDSDFGLVLPKSWLQIKGRQEVDIHPGDQIVVQSTVPASTAVSGQVMSAKPGAVSK